MPELVRKTETFPEGYRVTSTSTELGIEATLEHPRPLRLDREKLAAFGLRFAADHDIGVMSKPEIPGIVENMLGSLDRAAELMIRTKPRSEWKPDIENLKRIYIILGGLDENVIQQILDGEGG